MSDPRNPPKNDATLKGLERELKEAQKREADAEREAEQTLERAEELEKRSRELGEEGDRIRKKAAEPIGFPPPPNKEKGKG